MEFEQDYQSYFARLPDMFPSPFGVMEFEPSGSESFTESDLQNPKSARVQKAPLQMRISPFKEP